MYLPSVKCSWNRDALEAIESVVLMFLNYLPVLGYDEGKFG